MTNRTKTGIRNLDGPTAEVQKVDDNLLTIVEVAAIVRAPVATLRYWRYLGIGPRSFRVGRGVRYWRADVGAWLEQQKQADDVRADASSTDR
jgi:predicted DNA-binding transcriptional regulator AlpA